MKKKDQTRAYGTLTEAEEERLVEKMNVFFSWTTVNEEYIVVSLFACQDSDLSSIPWRNMIIFSVQYGSVVSSVLVLSYKLAPYNFQNFVEIVKKRREWPKG